MERKLLFFDIDGTLIPDINRPIPDSTIEAIKTAQSHGHYTFINTGRPNSILPKELLDLGFDGYLCGCGTHITLKNELIINKLLEPKRCMEICLHARAKSIPIVMEGNDYCYIDKLGGSHPFLNESNNTLMAEFPGTIKDVSLFDEIQFGKFCVITESQEQLTEFLEPFSDYFEPIDRGNNFYEIVPIGFSKASAIDTVLHHLNQPLSDCYAFGDSTNDLSMLNHVPHSIAMGNSSESVLKAASYVTTPVWRDGIYVAMKHFGLI